MADDTEAKQKVERILDGWQFGRDESELREMNGSKCGSRQSGYLRGVTSPGMRWTKKPKDKKIQKL